MVFREKVNLPNLKMVPSLNPVCLVNLKEKNKTKQSY